MKFTENQIDLLRSSVRERLSEKRYIHTLGVEKMAVKIGQKCLPDRIDELSVAALLHDISKEYSEQEQISLANRHNFIFSDEDKQAPQLWHSLTAPFAVMDDFSQFASPDILSAVRNHTVGSPDMTVLDEIILLADYIEEGRKYENCVRLREDFLSELDGTKNTDEAVICLHKATARSLDNNINEFVSRGKAFHSKTAETRDAILAKAERRIYGN